MNYDVISHADEVIAAKDKAIAKALKMIGLQAENYAHDKLDQLVYSAPESSWYVRTGNLRNKTTHEVISDDTVAIGSAVEYAPYIEFGTGIYAEGGGRQDPWMFQDEYGNWHKTEGMKPRPFIRPAAMEHNEEYKEIVKACLKGE